jgi:hypothetical protein
VHETGEICWWQADLPFDLPPSVLLSWQEEILAAGAVTGVFRVEEIPRIGYQRPRDGDVVTFVRSSSDVLRGDQPLLPNGFVLPALESSLLPRPAASTRLTYVEVTGELTETCIREMDVLCRRLGFERWSDLPAFDVTFDLGLEAVPDDARWRTYFMLPADIWLPWTSAFSHGYHLREPLDNRVLAGHNAPRLNAFLSRVRQAVLDLGGTWMPIPHGRYATQIDEFGVVLDAPRPDWSR